MRSDQLQIQLRTRTPWEAADLGFQLTRSYAKSVYATWCLAFFPAAILIGLLSHLLLGNVWFAMLLLWWLKPIFDVPVLHILSRAVFGEQLSPRQAIKLAWQRANWGQLLRWVTYRRLHPARSLYLPVDFLERETGARRNMRTQVLARAQGSPSSLLTIIGIHMESMLVISILMLGFLFVPTEFFSDAMKDVFDRLFSEPPIWFEWINHLVYAAAVTIFEPFYVGAGFGLYLNRRMELEAWDLDLSFRDLSARIASGARGIIASFLLIFAGAAALPSEAFAQSNTPEAQEDPYKPTTNEEALRIARELANKREFFVEGEDSDSAEDSETVDSAADSEASEEYSDENEDEEWSPEKPSWQSAFGTDLVKENDVFDRALEETIKSKELNPETEISEWKSTSRSTSDARGSTNSFSWLGQIVGFLAQNIVYVVLIVLLILIAPYLIQLLQKAQFPGKRKREADPLAQSDVELPERIPDNLAAQVSELWQQGKARAATALLYRASVLRLFELLGIAMPKGATESQCLRRARELQDAPQFGHLFQEIVRYWQGVAYANRQPVWADLQAFLARWQNDGGLQAASQTDAAPGGR